ncbi:MAG: hypothetical protein ACRDTH_18530 [Pseudonocardiaceae bacterium]
MAAGEQVDQATHPPTTYLPFGLTIATDASPEVLQVVTRLRWTAEQRSRPGQPPYPRVAMGAVRSRRLRRNGSR